MYSNYLLTIYFGRIITSISCIHGGVVEHDRLPATIDRTNRPVLGGQDVAPRFIWMRQRGALLFGTEYILLLSCTRDT